jgi:hypothetical protein
MLTLMIIILAYTHADCFYSHILCHHYQDQSRVDMVAVPQSFQEDHRHRSLGLVEEVMLYNHLDM